MKTLILSGGSVHEHGWTTRQLISMLTERRAAKCRTVGSPDELTDRHLAWADVVVINYTGGDLSEDRAAAVQDFVARGGGLVGIHGAADSFRNSERYLNLIGCEFITHGPPTPIRIHLDRPDHQITMHVDDQFVIHDEIYQCRLHGNPTVLASVNWQRENFPIITINTHGKGRVYYNALGHYRSAWKQRQFRALLLRGIDWVYTGPIRKDLGVGLLGVGAAFGMGSLHAKFINKAFGLQVKAACDVVPDRLDAIKKELPRIRTYQKVDDMLKDKAVDLVTVILPHNIHAEMAAKCLRAGKHVVVEKPFTVNVAEATRLINLARRNKRMLTCFQNRHWDPEILTIREIIDSGRIGKVFQIRIQCGGCGMPGEWWRAFKDISGGTLHDWAAHHFEWLLQLADSEVQSVFCGTHKLRWHWCSNEENAKVVIRFQDGLLAEYHASALNPLQGDPYVTVWATQGAVTIERAADQTRARVIRCDESGKVVAEEVISLGENQWQRFYQNVADHLHFGEPLVISPQHARRVISLIEAAYESADRGCSVRPQFP